MITLAQRKERTKAIREGLKSLVDWRKVIGSLDPYLPSYFEDLARLTSPIFEAYLVQHFKDFDNKDAELEFRQLLAVSQSSSIYFAQLLCIGILSNHKETKDLCKHLIHENEEQLRSCLISSSLIFKTDSHSDRASSCNLTGAQYVRLFLAKAYRADLSANKVLKLIKNERRASLHQKTREFSRFLDALKIRGAVTRRLSLESFQFLDDESLHILVNGCPRTLSLIPVSFHDAALNNPRLLFLELKRQRDCAITLEAAFEKALFDGQLSTLDVPEALSFADTYRLKKLSKRLTEDVLAKAYEAGPKSVSYWVPLTAVQAKTLSEFEFVVPGGTLALSLDELKSGILADPKLWGDADLFSVVCPWFRLVLG